MQAPSSAPIIEINPLLDWNDVDQAARFADPLAKVIGFLTVQGIPHRVVTAIGPANGSSGGEPAPLKAAPPVAAPAKAKGKAKAQVVAAAPDVDVPLPDFDLPAPLPEPFPDDAPVPIERSDEDKKGRALALLRHVYVAPNGGADAVKKLQKARKVAKFADVSLDDAHDLLIEAEALAREFSVVLPEVLSPG